MQGKVPAPAGKLPQRPSQAFRTTASGMPRGTRRCGASGSWGSAEIVRDSVVDRRDCRVWSAEWGASLALGRDVSAESLDVRTGKNLRTSSPLLPRASQICNSLVLNPRNILVKMISQAGTGYSFNTKRSRLREKLTLLHYDPVVAASLLGLGPGLHCENEGRN
ncbi:39S ribosomal protein L33, mitochondrial isoform X1 [Pteropus alecto]|uniref:39S ribosomal protein L33, mitochondrial isoform X1 n=1 Tax=Pteropus alecto TaxID=9402 RepID=UPI000D532876|nr:39S ribosomal protein L33, mitochondrial isoform X1 [Pteropus alecto]